MGFVAYIIIDIYFAYLVDKAVKDLVLQERLQSDKSTRTHWVELKWRTIRTVAGGGQGYE